jgi:hypothetical protein
MWTELMEEFIEKVALSIFFYLAPACLWSSLLDPDLFEARAILHAKMGEHDQALELYVYKLADYLKAEESVNLHISR